MQLTTLTLCLAALTSTAAALPHLSGAYHGDRIAVHVPTNTTGSHNATASTRGKAPLSTGVSRGNLTHGPAVPHIANHINVNHCHELCSLQSQACSLAVPEDDKFCWSTYLQCIDKCHPEDF